MSEYFYVVDENDNIVCKATREECHSGKRLIHRSVCVFVINDKNELFIQKRSMAKDLYAGYYTGSATGHVEFGEDYEEAARRELKEELGIEAPLEMITKVKNFSEIEREISTLYICRYNGKIEYNRGEVTEGFFLSLDEIKRWLGSGEKKFAYGFKIAFTELLKHISGASQS